MILSFTEFINESKSVGILYHFTNYQNFEEIVKSNFIFSSNYHVKDFNKPTVSLSRRADGNFMNTKDRMVRFTFDGDKMSENLKVVPLIDAKRGYGRKAWDSQKDEVETVIITAPGKPGYGEAVDLKKYITRIDIIFSNMFDRKLEEELDFLKSIDILVYIHENTWKSTHEFNVKKMNKSDFKKIN